MYYEYIDTREIELSHKSFKGNGFEKGHDMRGNCYYVNDQQDNEFVVYYNSDYNSLYFYIYNTSGRELKIKSLAKLIILFEAYTGTNFRL